MLTEHKNQRPPHTVLTMIAQHTLQAAPERDSVHDTPQR
jgi:hypothetical protein